jgi:hypothetical protein
MFPNLYVKKTELFPVDSGPVLGYLNGAEVGRVADVSEVLASPTFMPEVRYYN